MNWVDITIIVFAVIGAFIGWRQGLLKTVFSFVGLLVGVVLAGHYSDGLADKFSSRGAEWASILAFVLIVILVLIVFSIVGSIIVKKFIEFIMMGWVDSLGGIILGLGVGALLIAAIFTAIANWEWLQHTQLTSGIQQAIKDSSLADFLIHNFRLLLALLPDKFDDAVKGLFG